MIVLPEKVARELTIMLKRVIADIEQILPAGEKITVSFRFGDCVPFNVEIEGKS